MKNLILTSIILIIFTKTNCLSQNTSGILFYDGFLVQDSAFVYKEKEINNQQLKSIFKRINNNNQVLGFKLKYNKSESYFSIEEKMDVEASFDYKLAYALLGGNSEYYYIKDEDNYLESIEAYGERFLVETPNYHWELESEIQQIGDYLCQKATTEHVVNNSKGQFKHKVTAWYSKQLNIPFGPRGFNGLPGVMVQLEYQNIKFLLVSVELEPEKQIKITKPKNGEKVTKEEFEKIGKNSREMFIGR